MNHCVHPHAQATSLFACLMHILLILVTLISCARSHNKETKL